MLLGPSNEILLSDAARGTEGAVYVLQGKERKAIIEGLDRPYGLALQDGYLYVGEPESIKRYKYDAKAMTAGPGQEIISLKGFGGGHWTRSLLFSPRWQDASASASVPVPTSRPAKIPAAPPSTATTPMAPATKSTPPARATPSASATTPAPTPCGPPCRSATNWVTTWSPTTSPTSRRAASTAGRTPTPAPTKTRATRASAPTWWRRPFRATSCWVRTSPCSISSSTPVNSSPRNTRAAPSLPSTAPGTAPSASASPSPSFPSRTASPPAP